MKKGHPVLTKRLLDLSKCVERRMWIHESPLQQFPILKFDTLRKLQEKRLDIDRLRDMDAKEIGN